MARVCPPSSPDLIPSKICVSVQIKYLIGSHKAKNVQALSVSHSACLMMLGECRNVQGLTESAKKSRTLGALYYSSVR